MPTISREWRLAGRPHSDPTPDCFTLAEAKLPDPEPGQVLVRNTWMSVDPYMRGRMADRASYVAPFQIGEPLEGGAIGVVAASKDPELTAGDSVLHNSGWREYAVLDTQHVRKVDTTLAPAQAYLGVLGCPVSPPMPGWSRSPPSAPGTLSSFPRRQARSAASSGRSRSSRARAGWRAVRARWTRSPGCSTRPASTRPSVTGTGLFPSVVRLKFAR